MKLTTLSVAAAFSALALAAGSAHATAAAPVSVYELTPDPLTPGVVSTSPTITVGSGTTVDDFTFSITNDYNTSSTGLFFEFPQYGLSINSADLGLYAGTPGSPGMELADTGVFDPSTTAKTLGASLSAGSYFVQSTVTVPSGSSGAFSIAATVSAAPELSAWMLMVAGIGMLGFALRGAAEKRVSTLQLSA